MRVAVAIPNIVSSGRANLKTIQRLTSEANMEKADLIVFPEMALTGFILTEVPANGFERAIRVPGAETHELAEIAAINSTYLAVGVLEREDREMYDTALLFSPAGRLILKYRRISSGWHTRQANPSKYRHGDEITVADTDIGKLAFLICGDITDNSLLDKVKALDVDLLLFPIARQYDDDVHSEQEWFESEIHSYATHIARMETTTLLSNYVSDLDGCFGGAVAFDRDGGILASHPLHESGLLLMDI